MLGYIVRGPLEGMVWSNLQFLRGLALLGHEVYFVEDSDDYPSCYDPIRGVTDCDPSAGLAFAGRVLGRIGFAERWAYRDAHTDRWLGSGAREVLPFCRSADIVLNLCGVNPIRPWLEQVPIRALVDEDPAFTQIRHIQDSHARTRAAQHNVFLSFGVNIGRPGCTVPDDGFPWKPTRQPVVLDATVPAVPKPAERFTTVMQWNSYPPVSHRGVTYGMKSDAFGPYVDVPARVEEELELAVTGNAFPTAAMTQHGWHLRDAVEITREVGGYDRYIRGSKAEFSVAKHGYCISRSGWFSERSVKYLSLGRPVVLQDTGFSEWLNCGAGLLTFSTPDEACFAIEDISARYDYHSRKSLEVAAEYFDSRRVLRTLLDTCSQTPHPGDPL